MQIISNKKKFSYEVKIKISSYLREEINKNLEELLDNLKNSLNFYIISLNSFNDAEGAFLTYQNTIHQIKYFKNITRAIHFLHHIEFRN